MPYLRLHSHNLNRTSRENERSRFAPEMISGGWSLRDRAKRGHVALGGAVLHFTTREEAAQAARDWQRLSDTPPYRRHHVYEASGPVYGWVK